MKRQAYLSSWTWSIVIGCSLLPPPRVAGQCELAKLTASDATSDAYFGLAVAVRGDVAVVGAPGDPGTIMLPSAGAAYVFRRSGDSWLEEAKLTPSDAVERAAFGWSVAVNETGDVIVVGAPGDGTTGAPRAGSAYVFRRVGSAWVEEAILTAPDGYAGDSFGRAAAISGDHIAVGAPAYDVGSNVDSGAAYVFVHDGSVWTFEVRLSASSVTGQSFGWVVALQDDVVAVGAPFYQTQTYSDGAVYVYRRDGSNWPLETRILAPSGMDAATMGWSVSLDGIVLAAGDVRADASGVHWSGAAFVFEYDAGTWTFRSRLVAHDPAEYDGLGGSVAVRGDLIVAGAPDHFPGGAVYAFQRVGADWTLTQELRASDASYEFLLGRGLATDGGVVFAGDTYHRGIDDLRTGAVYVFQPGIVADCDGDKIDDACATEAGLIVDCNANQSPDACDISGGTSADCNTNAIPDECEPDCNANNSPDDCDIRDAVSADCNTNAQPDECDLSSGSSADCNTNTLPDECDIAGGTSGDCNSDGVPDECELNIDCNNNLQADICDIGTGTSTDCNENAIPDECDIADGTSQDADGDGLPDECCPAVAPQPEMIDANASATTTLVPLRMLRHLALRSNGATVPQAVCVRFVSLPPPWDIWNGTVLWATGPVVLCETAGIGYGGNCGTGPAIHVSRLTCDPGAAAFIDWSAVNGGVLYITHPGIVPTARLGSPPAVYELLTYDMGSNLLATNPSCEPLTVTNPRWGDLCGSFDPGAQLWVAPNESVGITTDVTALLNKFSNRPGSPSKLRCDVEPCKTDGRINVSDVTRTLDAFSGIFFPFSPTSGFGCNSADPCSYGP